MSSSATLARASQEHHTVQGSDGFFSFLPAYAFAVAVTLTSILMFGEWLCSLSITVTM